MIGVLAAAGSTNPTAIIGPTLVATFIGSAAGVLAARLLQRFYPQAPVSRTPVVVAAASSTHAPDASDASDSSDAAGEVRR
jgi:spore maturation protein SpmA